MGLISGLLKTAVNTVTLPLSIVGDVIDTATDKRDPFDESKTEKKVKKLGESIEETFDGDLL